MVWIPWQSVQTGASQLPRSDRLPVNALHVDALHLGVALAACGGDVELVDGRAGVVGGKNLMRAMAVRADRRGLRSVLHRVTVDAVLVGHKDLRAAAGQLHQKLLPVACAAGGGDVGVADGRLGIARRQNCVRVAVTIDAGGGRRPVGLLRGGVEAVPVRGLRIGVALGAGDLRGSRFVRRRLHVLVAVHAGEHTAVDGLLHLAGIDGEADRPAAGVSGGECGGPRDRRDTPRPSACAGRGQAS